MKKAAVKKTKKPQTFTLMSLLRFYGVQKKKNCRRLWRMKLRLAKLFGWYSLCHAAAASHVFQRSYTNANSLLWRYKPNHKEKDD